MKLIVPITIVLSNLAVGQIPAGYTHPSDIQRTARVVSFGGLQIHLVHFRRNNEASQEYPSYCSAALFVLRDADTLAQVSFENIEAFGGYAGIFQSREQPSPHHIAFTKLGDYDGRLILISDGGQFFNMPGGSYGVFSGRWLVSVHETDGFGPFVIFDLSQNKLVPIDSKNLIAESDVGLHFYTRRDKLFVETPRSVGQTFFEPFYQIDFLSRRLIPVRNLPPADTQIWNLINGSDSDADNCSCAEH